MKVYRILVAFIEHVFTLNPDASEEVVVAVIDDTIQLGELLDDRLDVDGEAARFLVRLIRNGVQRSLFDRDTGATTAANPAPRVEHRHEGV